MSHPPNSFTATGVVGHYVVPAQAIQSAISTHQHKSTRIDKVARGDKLAEAHMEYQVATDAFSRGQLTWAEYDIVLRRVNDVGAAHDKHLADYLARKQAGQTTRGDFLQGVLWVHA